MLWKLKLAMIATAALIIGASTLAIAVILTYLGVSNIYFIIGAAIAFNLLQWLLSPYVINAVYHVEEADPIRYPELHDVLERLCRRAGMPKPKLMIAHIPIPNAFAYGSPLTGNMVAVTTGLLDTLSIDEIEGVLGHELGHIKHRDMHIMMLASVLPSIFYILAYSMLYTGGDEEDRGALALVGALSFAAYWVLSLFVLHLSRLREYYADSFSVDLAPSPEEGARRLARALAKIVARTTSVKAYMPRSSGYAFKALFISDPERAEADLLELRSTGIEDELVREILRQKVTLADTVSELFSTHPNIVKRIKAMFEYARLKTAF